MPRLKSSRISYGSAVAFFTIFAILFISPFLLGGNRAPYEAMFAIVGWLGLGSLLLHYRLNHQTSVGVPFVIPIGLTILLGALALIPWPEQIYADLYPNQYNLLTYLKPLLPAPLSEEVLFRLSLNPATTAQGLLRWVATLCVVIVTFRFLLKKSRRIQYLQLINVLSLLVFLTALLHQLLGLSEIMGLEPGAPDTFFFAPLRNHNHLARIFGLFAFLNLYGASITNHLPWRISFQAAGALSIFGVAATQSRGGILFLVVGLAYVFVQNIRERQNLSRKGRKTSSLPNKVLTLAFIALTLMGLYSFMHVLTQEAQQSIHLGLNDPKWGSWILAHLFIQDHPWMGAGLNALSGGISQYFSLDSNFFIVWGQSRVHYAENIFLDVFAAFGFLGGGLLIAAWCHELYANYKSKTHRTPSYITAGIFFVLAAELVDYALVTPCILWLTLILALLGINPKKSRHVSLKVATGVWLLLLPCILFLTSIAVPADRKKLDLQLMRQQPITLLKLMEIQKSHPFDANLSFEIASRFRQQNDLKTSLKWSNYAMLLWPTLHGAHIEAARALSLMGKNDQAMIEYKLALKVKPLLIDAVIDDFVKLKVSPSLQIKAIPADQSRSVYHLCLSFNSYADRSDQTACALQQLKMQDGESHHYAHALRFLIRHQLLEPVNTWLKTSQAGILPDGEKHTLRAMMSQQEQSLDTVMKNAFAQLAQLKQPKALGFWLIESCSKNLIITLCTKTLAEMEAMVLSNEERKQLSWHKFRYLSQKKDWTFAYKEIVSLSKTHPSDMTLQKALLQTQIRLTLLKEARKTFQRIQAQLSAADQAYFYTQLNP